MAVINVLDHNTVDQIAAGEVVERPLSVVKELVENSIDAGADSITVEIKEGGISFLRVTDNGCGIEYSEIHKAFLRHATSKIETAEDLQHISSLGFRGEALSSIAAVSKVEMITKTKDRLTGSRLVLEGADEVELTEIGAPDGTTMIVRNLFFNTPVRQKFLKSAQTEGSYITEMMEHMVLSHPDISFKYILNGQEKFATSGNDNLKEVIYRIYGKDIANNMLPIHQEGNGVILKGFIGTSVCNRPSRSFETYFINGRYIKSSMLSKALEEGYHNYLMQHKYPFVVLNLIIDCELLDVNVHPTKMDIRFSNSSYLFDFIASSVSACLNVHDLVPEVSFDTHEVEETVKTEMPKAPEPFEIHRESKWKELGHVLGQKPDVKAESRLPNVIKAKEQIIVERAKQMSLFAPLEPLEKSDISGNYDTIESEKQEENRVSEEPQIWQIPNNEVNENKITVMGQIFDTYWLFSFDDKLYMMDQHAAHEKVNYEKMMKQLKEGEIPSQMLEPPVILTFSAREEDAFRKEEEHFKHLGFEVEHFGGTEYAIRQAPLELYGNTLKDLFLNILDESIDGQLKGTSILVEEKIASMSCKASVKGNQQLSFQEAEALIKKLFTLDNPYFCPHGRPTMISMSKYEIDKKFKRIV